MANPVAFAKNRNEQIPLFLIVYPARNFYLPPQSRKEIFKQQHFFRLSSQRPCAVNIIVSGECSFGEGLHPENRMNAKLIDYLLAQCTRRRAQTKMSIVSRVFRNFQEITPPGSHPMGHIEHRHAPSAVAQLVPKGPLSLPAGLSVGARRPVTRSPSNDSEACLRILPYKKSAKRYWQKKARVPHGCMGPFSQKAAKCRQLPQGNKFSHQTNIAGIEAQQHDGCASFHRFNLSCTTPISLATQGCSLRRLGADVV